VGGSGLFLVDFELANEDTRFTPKYLSRCLRGTYHAVFDFCPSIFEGSVRWQGWGQKGETSAHELWERDAASLIQHSNLFYFKGKDSRSSMRDTFKGIDKVHHTHVVGKSKLCDEKTRRFVSVRHPAIASM